ncbi:uncharacterized protein CDAR_121001 [Caerostris darwini]|uniref:Uncharacterized protein n=1 Tax=Caerostris darwini TaxID=1538125 RepID=A0AAV4MA95_9ARAC|nr:uncharacterized protein CDAR_121001 [Caerostris darwini]
MNSDCILSNMDQLFDTYKQIVDRAISLGLLSEESKSYYMSAVGEDTGINNTIDTHECSEEQAEDVQSQEDQLNPSSLLNSHELSNCTSGFESYYNRRQINANKDFEDPKSEAAGGSIENYNILDINHFQKMNQCSPETDTDVNSFLKNACKISSDDSPIIRLSKVRRKPKKNEVVDFHIPIYLDLKKKKVSVKPSKLKRQHTSHKKVTICTETCNLEKSEKDSENEHLKNKRNVQLPVLKHRSRIPKRVNVACVDKNKTTSEICHSSNINTGFIKQIIAEALSSQNDRSTVVPSNAIPIPSQFNDENDLEPQVKIKEPAAIAKDKRNTHQGKQNSKNAVSSCHVDVQENIKSLSNWKKLSTSDKSKSCFERHFPSVDVPEDLIQFSSSDEANFSKAVHVCDNTGENLDNHSDDSICKDSIQTEVEDEKLLNVNIICQFFPSSSSDGKNDTTSLEKIPQPEVENNKSVSPESETKTDKKKTIRKSGSHFLSKIFSRSKAQ